MPATGIGAALGLFILEAVQFREDVDRDANMIVFEAAQAPRVVQQNVGIENEVFAKSGRSDETEVLRLPLRQCSACCSSQRVLVGDDFRLRVVVLVNHVEGQWIDNSC